MQTRVFARVEIRRLLGLVLALMVLVLFAVFPRSSQSQSQSHSSSASNAQQQSGQVTSAMPVVTTTSYMLSASSATGHAQTIRLPGVSDEPLVHSSFEQQTVLAQPVYHGGGIGSALNARSAEPASIYRGGETASVLNAISPEPAQVYRTGGDEGETRAMNVLNGETSTPIFSSPAGEYAGSLRVMLSADSPGSAIYFTLDGDTPTTESFKYIHPFTLHASATLKAIAISDEKTPSRIAQAEYKIVEPTLGFEVGDNGVDRVEIFLTLNAPGAASVAGTWTITDGAVTVCSAELTTETSMHCPAKLNRGMHDLKATYNGAYNGWQLTKESKVRID